MPSASGGNAMFLPKVTEGLLVGYSRNEKDWMVNDVVKLTPVDQQVGYFPKIRPQEAARLLDDAYRGWADGSNRPISDFNKDQWEFIEYRTRRTGESIPLGYLGLEQAVFPVAEAQSQSMAMRGMLYRTKKFFEVLTTTGNYLTTHTQTATAWGGGQWGTSTVAQRFIQKTIQAVARQIELATLGVVKLKDLTLIISPTVANAIATSPEIAEGFIQSQFALDQVQGDAGWNKQYGLPDRLYGMKLRVDPSVEVTTQMNTAGTATRAYVASADDAYVIARPGDLVNNSSVASDFSTVHCFTYSKEEMLSEMIDDPLNKRKLVSFTDNFQMKLVAQETLARITDVLA